MSEAEPVLWVGWAWVYREGWVRECQGDYCTCWVQLRAKHEELNAVLLVLREGEVPPDGPPRRPRR